MPDAVSLTTPQCAPDPAPRPWVAPRLAELPKLTALTLASAIGGTGGTGGSGSTVFGLLLAIGLLFGAAACAPERESTVGPTEGGPEVSAQQLDCRADLAAHTLDCAPASRPQAGPGQTIFGQQGILV